MAGLLMAAAAACDGGDGGDSCGDAPPICSLGWCWEHGGPEWNAVLALDDEVWVAGQGGVILRFDGCDWARVESGVDYPLSALWGQDRDLWAVSSGVLQADGTRVGGGVLHWDGATWTEMEGVGAQHDVWASASDDIWVAGAAGVMRGDGTSWSQVHPDPASTLWGASSDDVWVGGSSGLRHWDGATWTETPTTSYVVSIDGTGPDDVWAAVQSGGDLAPLQWTLLHWDGSSWSPATDVVSADSIDARTTSDVWTVGSKGTWHWDGATWSEIGGVGRAVSAPAEDEAWVVGVSGDVTRWDGTRLQPSLGAVLTSGSVVGLSANQDGQWAIAQGKLLHRDAGGWRVAYEDDRLWFDAVWASPDGGVWAGGGGTVVRWDGSAATRWDLDTSSLYAVWGTASDDVWAAGTGATVFHWGGQLWAGVALGQPIDRITSLWGSAADDVYAVGATSPEQVTVVMRWDGTAWTRDTSIGSDFSFADWSEVWGSGEGDVWLLRFRELYRRGNAEWILVDGPQTDFTPAEGWSLAPDDVWTAGIGFAAHWDGSSWTTLPTPTRVVLGDMNADAAGDLWLSGERGIIIRRQR